MSELSSFYSYSYSVSNFIKGYFDFLVCLLLSLMVISNLEVYNKRTDGACSVCIRMQGISF